MIPNRFKDVLSNWTIFRLFLNANRCQLTILALYMAFGFFVLLLFDYPLANPVLKWLLVTVILYVDFAILIPFCSIRVNG